MGHGAAKHTSIADATLSLTTMRSAVLLSVLVAVVALLALPAQAIGVVSIDYGTEWIKAALVKPGMPFDVVLGRDSKRKVQASVAFKGAAAQDGNFAKQEQVIGSDAYMYASRSPTQSFHAAKLLLGQTCHAGKPMPAQADAYRRVFGNHVSPLPETYSTGSSCVVYPSVDVPAFWRPEEIVGMQLNHIRELAEETAGEMFSIGDLGLPSSFSAQHGLDTVVTVPVYYTSYERQALLDAAVLAGFRPAILSDAAAAATAFAQTRSFPMPERHIFYDAGSGAVRASLVEFASDTARRDAVNVTVLDAAWDRGAGGLEMDLLVRDMLAEAFDAQHQRKTPTRDEPRAMARLLRDANKVKHVLSANAEASANVESLLDDLDLRTTVSRDAFEARLRSSGLLRRFSAPVTELLKRSNLRIDDVASVVLVGGASRVPAVHRELHAAGVPESKLAQNVNADEAAVMGAALFAAGQLPQLRMRPMNVRDVLLYQLELDGKTLFAVGPQGMQTHVQEYAGVTHNQHFALRETSARLPAGDDGMRFDVRLENIPESLAELAEKDELKHVSTLVNVSVTNKPFGTYMLHDAFLTIKPHTKITSRLRSFLHLHEQPNATDSLEPRSVRVSLNATSLAPVRPLGGMDKIQSIERLHKIAFEAKQRAQREVAFNELESGVYAAQSLLDDVAMAPYMSGAERTAIEAAVERVGGWLGSDGDSADRAAILKKGKSLSALVDPVRRRASEALRREEAMTELTHALSDAMAFVIEARMNLTAAMKAQEPSKYSMTELDTFENAVEKDFRWLEEGGRAQTKRSAHEDPVLYVDDMEKRAKKARDAVRRFMKRRITKTRPKGAKGAGASTAQSESVPPVNATQADAAGNTQRHATGNEPVTTQGSATTAQATPAQGNATTAQATPAQGNATTAQATPAQGNATTVQSDAEGAADAASTSESPLHDEL